MRRAMAYRTHTVLPALLLMLIMLLSASLATHAQGTGHKLFCRVWGPDSVFFDKTTYNRYIPGTFQVDVMLTNFGETTIDSIVAFPRSNQLFTIMPPSVRLVSQRMQPRDTVYTDFSLIVNPRETSGLDTITIAVTGKGGARTECNLVVWVEKEYRPVNEILCPSSGSITTTFVDSLNSYVPNPLFLPLTVLNNGDAPSKNTRLFYVATPGVSPAEGQLPILELGTLTAGERRDLGFELSVNPRSEDTTIQVPFRLQGFGGLGDRIIDTLCSFELFIPRSREVYFALECESDPGITYKDGAYVPNPFAWNVTVRNTGNARAKNVRAIIALPEAYILEPGYDQEQDLGDLDPGATNSMLWMVRARPVFKQDTSEICVRAFDTFNRIANCCDSLILPSVRAPSLETHCNVVPDSIRVDTQTGMYQPAEFVVPVRISNLGTDPADSVWAEIVIADPDIEFLSPPQSRQLVSQSIAPNTDVSVQWQLRPIAVEVPRNLSFTIRVSSRNAPTVSTSCTVFIAAAIRPELQCSATITPDDTLHFNSSTLDYDNLSFSAEVVNVGSVAARNMQATILLPPNNIGLQAGESPVKYLNQPLEHDGRWKVDWKLLPLKNREGSYNEIEVEFRSGSSAVISTMCHDWIFLVGIPPITVFTIPRNMVARHSNEITVPILIDDSENKDVTRIELAVNYDASKLDFLGFILDSMLLDAPWIVAPRSVPGTAAFVAEHPAGALDGNGELLAMRFRVRFGLDPDQLNWADVPLIFDSLSSGVNRGSILARYFNGGIIVSGDCLYPLDAAESYVIVRNLPNPFNPSTVVRVEIGTAAHSTLEVYDMYGRRVAVLHDGWLEAGTHDFPLHADRWPSGVYNAILRSSNAAAMHKLLLAK